MCRGPSRSLRRKREIGTGTGRGRHVKASNALKEKSTVMGGGVVPLPGRKGDEFDEVHPKSHTTKPLWGERKRKKTPSTYKLEGKGW